MVKSERLDVLGVHVASMLLVWFVAMPCFHDWIVDVLEEFE